MAERSDRRDVAVAALAYAAASVGFFGATLCGRPSSAFIGITGDPVLFMWCFAWWPYAIAHGLNPFVSHVVWAPTGVDLVWRTSLPAVSVAITPVTTLAGPVVAYNIVAVLAPASAALAAYSLCRYVTGNPRASLVGGYLFGFSSYELAHIFGGHLNLTLTFIVPLLVYLVLLRHDDRIAPARFGAAFTLLLVLQFFISTEVFATLTLVGVVAGALATLFVPRDTWRDVARHVGGAYLVALLILSPVLVVAFLHGVPQPAGLDPTRFAADPLNLVVPTPLSLSSWLLGGPPHHFSGNNTEASAYLGVPLLAVLVLVAWESWRTRAGAFLVVLMAVICLIAVGPAVQIAGTEIPLPPGQILTRLPILRLALPARVMMYGALVAAVMTAVWLARGRRPLAWTRWVMVLLAVAATLPNVLLPSWTSPLQTPSFIADRIFRQYVSRNDNVLVIPFVAASEPLQWQWQSGMYFRVAAAYAGPFQIDFPQDFTRWPISDSLTCGALVPDHERQLEAWLANAGVSAVVVEDGTPGQWRELFTPLDGAPVHVGGVTVYRVRLERPSDARTRTWREMRQEAYLAQFSALLSAAERYVSVPSSAPAISVAAVQRVHLLPNWGCAAAPRGLDSGVWDHEHLWLGALPGGRVGVSILGAPQDLTLVAGRFAGYADAMRYPAPIDVVTQYRSESVTRVEPGLLMVFSRAGLARAAARGETGTGPK